MLTIKSAVCCVVLVLAAVCSLPSLSAATIFTTIQSGANEVPPSGSPATGSVVVTLNGDMLTINDVFSGLTASASAAHIHCCAPAGTNAQVAIPFFGFPATTFGTFNTTVDLTSAATYTAGFLAFAGGTAALAEAAVIAGLNSGQTYANIHNANFPGGEIRGQLALAVPEPTTGLLLMGLMPLFAIARKRIPRA